MANMNNNNGVRNFRNSMKIISISAKDGFVSRASMNTHAKRDPKTGKPDRKVHTQHGDMSQLGGTNQTLAIWYTAATILGLVNQGTHGVVSIVVPDTINLRFYEAQRILNNGDDPENLVKGWMTDKEKHPEYFMPEFDANGETVLDEDGEPNEVNVWEQVLVGTDENPDGINLYHALDEARKHGLRINLVGRHSIRYWEIYTSEDESHKRGYDYLKDGQTVKFERWGDEQDPRKTVGYILDKDGKVLTDDDGEGVAVFSENNFLVGEYEVKTYGQMKVVDRVLQRNEEGRIATEQGRAINMARFVDEKMQENLPHFDDIEDGMDDIEVIDDSVKEDEAEAAEIAG